MSGLPSPSLSAMADEMTEPRLPLESTVPSMLPSPLALTLLLCWACPNDDNMLGAMEAKMLLTVLLEAPVLPAMLENTDEVLLPKILLRILAPSTVSALLTLDVLPAWSLRALARAAAPSADCEFFCMPCIKVGRAELMTDETVLESIFSFFDRALTVSLLDNELNTFDKSISY